MTTLSYHSSLMRIRPEELIIDNFAGGGGASTGIEMALGRSPDIAINHDPEAIAMHEANHPFTRHFIEDVWDVDPRTVCAGRPVGLAWFSPDCFPAGTLVLTRTGYRPIEEIEVGDEVLTHKLRWRAVTEVSNTRRPLVNIKGHGHPGLLVSPEHPFYARQRKDVWNNERRNYDRVLETADWTPASVMDKGWYWATPTSFPEAEIPAVPGRGMEANAQLMWLVGCYLGDGWTRLTETRAKLVITCGRHEVARLRQLLAGWPRTDDRAGFNELEWHERETGTAYQFSTNHRGLVTWLREHFGHRAEAKSIPGWVLGASPEFKQALLDGYLSADGWNQGQFAECRTVSKALAFGIKAVLTSLGKTVAVYTRANSATIQGRAVNARPVFQLRWRAEVDADHVQTVREEGLEWCPIRSQALEAVEANVFNIGVDEDESYVVEGIVVHNCKHFSKAKGGRPVDKNIRGLAWVAVKWARHVKPRIIFLENVEEFQTWGPLKKNGKPDPKRKGETFRKWVRRLQKLGYHVEWRELKHHHWGVPTTRKRLFLIARCDGAPIIWPEETHGPSRAEPYRTSAQIIDFSIPCPSIFGRKKPLAENTMRRIARGVKRYVLDSQNPYIVPAKLPVSDAHAEAPFLVPTTHQGDARTYAPTDPTPTITGAHRGEHALVTPLLARLAQTGGNGKYVNGVDEPLTTIVSQAEHLLVAPTLVQVGYGEREGQQPRSLDIEQPLGTIVAQGNKFAMVASFLAKHNGGHEATGSELHEPVHTVTATDSHALVAVHLQQDYGRSIGSDAHEPVPTVTAGGSGHQALVSSSIVKLRGDTVTHPNTAQDIREPLPTITASGTHLGEMRAFLIKYYGTDQDPELDGPLHTITTKDRFGLVVVYGELYQIVDIGMRMLTPRELYRAQGFPETYIIDLIYKGKPLSKTAQVRMCGNSVSPMMAAVLVRANAGQTVRPADDAATWFPPANTKPGAQLDFLHVMKALA